MNSHTPIEKPKLRARKLEQDRIFTHDLHGFTLDEAYQYVKKLIADSQEYGIQELRIITGKSGRMAREFPSWMSTHHFREYVRGVSLEQGGGSYLVYLLTR